MQINIWQHTCRSVTIQIFYSKVNRSKASAKFSFGLLILWNLYALIQKKQKGNTIFEKKINYFQKK